MVLMMFSALAASPAMAKDNWQFISKKKPAPVVGAVEAVRFEGADDRLRFIIEANVPIDPTQVETQLDARDRVLIIRVGGLISRRRWLKTRHPMIKRTLQHPSRQRAPGAITRVRMKRKISKAIFQAVRFKVQGQTVTVEVPTSDAVAAQWATQPAKPAPIAAPVTEPEPPATVAIAAPIELPTPVEEDEPGLPPGLGGADDDEPGLPPGLGGDDDEPGLPMGLGGGDDEPGLPPGLGGDAGSAPAEVDSPSTYSPIFRGFVDARGAARLSDDANQKRASLGELRVQLAVDQPLPFGDLRVVADGLYDPVLDVYSPDLESGEGVIDLRETHLTVSPMPFADLRIGRQILTWGTGDFVFINDLFPKDWTAFIIGRDDAYLKAPSDAAKLSLFVGNVTLDLIYMPRFDADRFPDRRRVSSWSDFQMGIAGQNEVPRIDTPDGWFKDDEFHARLSGNLRGWEWALYGYRGFWKSPAGFDPMAGKGTHPKLNVYGGSLRGALGPGLISLEGGYYDSADDSDGTDPFVNNSEARALASYELELVKNLTSTWQWYLERRMDQDGYEAGRPPGAPVLDQSRHVLMTRLTHMALNQRLVTTLVAFYSPTDEDTFLRPRINYAWTDHWKTELGAQLFFGAEDYSFYNQFQTNNAFQASARYSW